MLSIFPIAIFYIFGKKYVRYVEIIYFRIWRFILFIIEPFRFHIPALYLKQ